MKRMNREKFLLTFLQVLIAAAFVVLIALFNGTISLL